MASRGNLFLFNQNLSNDSISGHFASLTLYRFNLPPSKLVGFRLKRGMSVPLSHPPFPRGGEIPKRD